MTKKRWVLELLDRNQLQQLVKEYELECVDRRSKSNLVDALARSRRVKLDLILEPLSRDTLRGICRTLDLDDTGREKSVLIDRIIKGEDARSESTDGDGVEVITLGNPCTKPGGGYVSFTSEENMDLIVEAAAEQGTLVWTVCETAEPGARVVFYATAIRKAFVACGRVLQRYPEDWHGKPMAEVFDVRLLPEPVPLQRAKELLGMSWLRIPAGFGRYEKEEVDQILTLGGIQED